MTTPTPDRFVPSMGAPADLDAYWEAVQERWAAYGQESFEHLALCGSVFRTLAAMRWGSRGMPHEWAPWSVANLRLYDAELTQALDVLGWAHPRSLVGVPAAPGGVDAS